ncbi:hypothetical protein GQ44DRAFT_82551 [Phaeosphaeriaceae sp. PMI808]|nr:hypothetical protein GQ44DRAFT_82551 [Phaeosphaeriaceae sp. PMI808]
MNLPAATAGLLKVATGFSSITTITTAHQTFSSHGQGNSCISRRDSARCPLFFSRSRRPQGSCSLCSPSSAIAAQDQQYLIPWEEEALVKFILQMPNFGYPIRIKFISGQCKGDAVTRFKNC